MRGLRVCILLSLISSQMFSARVGSLIQQAPAEARPLQNPFEGDVRAGQAGEKLYARECAACHGPRGGGFRKAPALTGADVTRGGPGALFWVLRNGSLLRGMPSFAHLPEPERWQLVTFVLSLQAKQ